MFINLATPPLPSSLSIFGTRSCQSILLPFNLIGSKQNLIVCLALKGLLIKPTGPGKAYLGLGTSFHLVLLPKPKRVLTFIFATNRKGFSCLKMKCIICFRFCIRLLLSGCEREALHQPRVFIQ